MYAVRFTPGINAKLAKAEFYVSSNADGIQGSGLLRVSLHQNATASVGGIPGTIIGNPITVPFSSLTKGTYNEVDFNSQNISLTANVDFHLVFEVLGAPGDTVQLVGDDGVNETDRSSSYYDAGLGLEWLNFIDVDNFGYGYNLAVRTYISFPTGEDDVQERPVDFRLEQNYPNPFNPKTNFEFQIANREKVKLAVFDLLGREVAVLVNEELSEGTHRVTWNGAGFTSGVYFYTLQSGAHRETKRMTLLK